MLSAWLWWFVVVVVVVVVVGGTGGDGGVALAVVSNMLTCCSLIGFCAGQTQGLLDDISNELERKLNTHDNLILCLIQKC